MKVFLHHIYEYQKGLRNLILHTASVTDKELIVKKLQKRNISFHIIAVNAAKINVFFGAKMCVDTVKSINKSKLSDYTAEEDFILGIMLGYDRKLQCERYLRQCNGGCANQRCGDKRSNAV